jgi:uncharacterized cofD-like protein
VTEPAPTNPGATNPGTTGSRRPPAPASAPSPNVVALGGGHGLATTLRAVRRYASRVTAVVSVADDGGSSGRLRQIAGIPAPGDLRRCLVAMASHTADSEIWTEAFEYRFPSGDLEGHALGNLLIAGLANVTGDFARALDLAASVVNAQGRVLPATTGPVVLKAEVAGAQVTEVIGQVNVASSQGAITSVSIVPPDASAPEEAIQAVREADQVVIGPGSLFTSVLAVCVVPDIRAALAARPRGRVYVCNLRPQLPETAGFEIEEHVGAVLDHGVAIDVVVAHRPDPEGSPGGRWPQEVRGVPVVLASLALPDGSGHDPQQLASVLATLP